jgi:hypothetical protein
MLRLIFNIPKNILQILRVLKRSVSHNIVLPTTLDTIRRSKQARLLQWSHNNNINDDEVERNAKLERERSVFGKMQTAVPLGANEHAQPGNVVVEWLTKRAKRAVKSQAAGSEPPEKSKVRLLTLLSYATARERWLMVLGLFSAGISGLSMPIWLLLLAESLETFNQIGRWAQCSTGTLLS